MADNQNQSANADLVNVRKDFAAVWTEWVHSREANGIGNLEPSREDLVFFLSDLSEEQLYAYIQGAMEGLDMRFSAREAEKKVLESDLLYYTIAPFGDEWVWNRTGTNPWVTKSLAEAIQKAREVRDSYVGINAPEMWEGFWSMIHASRLNPAAVLAGEQWDEEGNPSAAVGWVDPAGEFHVGFDPPIDSNGSYREESAIADREGG